MQRLLVQTTIPTRHDDWHVGRFSLLCDHLAGLRGPGGEKLYDVTARDRVGDDIDDPVLASIDAGAFDQLWLIAVDTGSGIRDAECTAIGRFRERGGGLMVTRDHQDLGISVCNLGGVGRAHHFHSKNQESDTTRQTIDDSGTTTISWPNYHSGSNGDLQTIAATDPVHPLLHAEGRVLSRFPAHPHEGAVSAPPDDPTARVIATGTSKITRRPFNIAVAFDAVDGTGNALAESTFHHFVDYNWDVRKGAPGFLSEAPGTGIAHDPHALDDIKAYVANAATWLGKNVR